MATSKPRIQAYVEQSLFDSFKAEQDAWGLTQSEALERILAERYGRKDDVETSSNQLEQSFLEGRLDRLDKLLQSLDRSFHFLSSRVSYLERKVAGELPSESLVSDSELPTGELPSESLVSDSELSGKLVICKVNKADSGDQSKWRYFANFKQGFVEQMDQARTYYPDTVRQIAGRIAKSPHKAVEGEMISWRPVAELEQLLAVGSQS